jgi:cell division protein FtsW
MVVYLAKVLSDGFGGSIKQFFWRAIFPIILVCGLIINGHTSNVAIIGGTSMMMIFMGASDKKYHAISAAIVLGIIVIYLLFYKDIGRGETASNRVKAWVTSTFSSEERNATQAKQRDKTKVAGYKQAEIAKYAIISGGFVRVAPGKSVYRKTLSEAHNDYIFAMIIEEYGLVGGIIVIIVYLILFYRILMVMRKCRKMFTSLLLSGLFIMIISQTFIHIGVSVGGFPITGQNLPMISTGGTSIIITSAAFGIILAVSRIVEESNHRYYKSDKTETA